MNILIIDDNCVIRELLISILSCNGHRVSSAENGREALQKAEQEGEQFDIIITDYHMPVMNGIEFLRRFKSKWPSIPVIVATGSLVAELDWNKLGALCVIYKPITAANLLPVLQSISDKNIPTVQ